MITRRVLGRMAAMAAGGIIPGLGGQPAPRPDQQYRGTTGQAIAPGSTNVFRGRLVVVFGPTGTVSGVFVYAPGTTPGRGNPPVDSITSSTTDPFGNPVVSGITAYDSAGDYAQLSSAQLTFFNKFFATTGLIHLDNTATGNMLFSATGNMIFQNPVFAQLPGSSPAAPEIWHPLPFTNGWSNQGGGQVTGQYRTTVEGSTEVIGSVAHASTSGTSQLATALPSFYLPASSINEPVADTDTTASVVTPKLQFDTAGVLTFVGLGAGTTNVQFHCTYPTTA